MKKQALTKLCPFKAEANCRDDCALYTIHGCAIVFQIDRSPATSTAGKDCPFAPGSCTETCALFNHGCILAAI